MPGCNMHSRPKLAEKARYNSLLNMEQTTTTTTTKPANAQASIYKCVMDFLSYI